MILIRELSNGFRNSTTMFLKAHLYVFFPGTPLKYRYFKLFAISYNEYFYCSVRSTVAIVNFLRNLVHKKLLKITFEQQEFAEARTYKMQERFIAPRRFGVVLTPLSRD